MKIAIAEGCASDASVLKKYAEKYLSESGFSAEISVFSSAGRLVSECRGYSVVFLDTSMPDMDGFAAAELLRRRERTVSIVFLSADAQSAVRGYEWDAEAFLVKPAEYSEFCAAAKKAFYSYMVREKRGVTLRTANGLCRFSADKLVYVEVLCHRLIYHFVDRDEEARGTLIAAERALFAYGFIRSGYSFLVNPKYIYRIEGRELYLADTVLTISRNRRAKFMEQFSEWLKGSQK